MVVFVRRFSAFIKITLWFAGGRFHPEGGALCLRSCVLVASAWGWCGCRGRASLVLPPALFSGQVCVGLVLLLCKQSVASASRRPLGLEFSLQEGFFPLSSVFRSLM